MIEQLSRIQINLTSKSERFFRQDFALSYLLVNSSLA